eukprot:SM000387S14697  [mRNA]  locus=s387:5332:6074:- [translate_table: standard]
MSRAQTKELHHRHHPCRPPGDGAAGRKIFEGKCASCHTVEKGAPHTDKGPNLGGLFGRPAGSARGYPYSPANLVKAVVWNEETLYHYLEDPKKFIPGTKKDMEGLKDPRDRCDVIAYLEKATQMEHFIA